MPTHEPPPRSQRFIADGERLPISARARWAWCALAEVALIAVMLLSDASWTVRTVVLVLGTVVIASMNVYWREHGWPADGDG